MNGRVRISKELYSTHQPAPMVSINEVASTVYRYWDFAVKSIAHLRLQHRSVLIKCAQAQWVPDAPCPLYDMISDLPPCLQWTRNTHHGRYEQYIDQHTLFNNFSGTMGPGRSPIILDLCRSLPLEYFEVVEAREKSWKKEGICIETLARKPEVDWNVIFENRKDDPMLPGIPPNPRMVQYIHGILKRFKNKCQGQTLFPRATQKNMSRSTRREFEREFKISLEDVPIFGQKDWQRVYHDTGIKVQGATEMRQKWYPSGAKPRTYFSQGGEHYARSNMLQDFFGDLVNALPQTNHISRLQPSRIILREGSRARVYDLSTFTSNFQEMRSFCEKLAEFFIGVPVVVFDAREGWIDADLGTLLYDYLHHCVQFPSVSYERSTPYTNPDDGITDHGSASMLGIFGNLMLCTLAHGILMSMVVELDEQLNIAGDDGIVDENDENQSYIDLCICALGSYERTKTFRSDEPGCICLKRPLTQRGSRLVPQIAIIPPNLSLCCYYLYNIPDIRYSFLNTPDHAGCLSIVGKDWMRCLRSLHRASSDLSDDELSPLLDAFANMTTMVFTRIVPGGLMQCGDPYFWPSPVTLETIRSEDPLETLIRNRYRGTITLLKQGYERLSAREISQLDVGEEFLCNSSRWLSSMEMLGYVERDDIEVLYSGVEGFDALRKALIDFDMPVIYRYRVAVEIAPRYVL